MSDIFCQLAASSSYDWNDNSVSPVVEGGSRSVGLWSIVLQEFRLSHSGTESWESTQVEIPQDRGCVHW